MERGRPDGVNASAASVAPSEWLSRVESGESETYRVPPAWIEPSAVKPRPMPHVTQESSDERRIEASEGDQSGLSTSPEELVISVPVEKAPADEVKRAPPERPSPPEGPFGEEKERESLEEPPSGLEAPAQMPFLESAPAKIDGGSPGEAAASSTVPARPPSLKADPPPRARRMEAKSPW